MRLVDLRRIDCELMGEKDQAWKEWQAEVKMAVTKGWKRDAALQPLRLAAVRRKTIVVHGGWEQSEGPAFDKASERSKSCVAQEVFKGWSTPPTAEEYYRNLAPLLVRLACGYVDVAGGIARRASNAKIIPERFSEAENAARQLFAGALAGGLTDPDCKGGQRLPAKTTAELERILADGAGTTDG